MVYATRRMEQSSFLNLISNRNMESKTSTPICPPAPVKKKKDRVMVVANQMLQDLNTLSIKISQDRRALDRLFVEWVSRKREFQDLINGHKDEDFYQLLSELSEDLCEEHFSKKRKAEFICTKE